MEPSSADAIDRLKDVVRSLKASQERAAAFERDAERYREELVSCRAELIASQSKCATLEQENKRLRAWERESRESIEQQQVELRDGRLAADQLEKVVKELTSKQGRLVRRAADDERRLTDQLRVASEQLVWTRDTLDAERAEARAKIKELREHLEQNAEAHERHALEGARLTRQLKQELLAARKDAAVLERSQLQQQRGIADALALLDAGN